MPGLLCTTPCYSSSTYKVLRQYFSVLQSTTPVLLGTTKYSVQQSTTPVLLCTTKYYASTTPNYTVPRQYYSVLQSTTPVLFLPTQYYASTALFSPKSYASATLYYKYYASTTLYYKVPCQYYSLLQGTTPVLLSTTKYYAATNPY